MKVIHVWRKSWTEKTEGVKILIQDGQTGSRPADERPRLFLRQFLERFSLSFVHRCFLETLSSFLSLPANPLSGGSLANPGRQQQKSRKRKQYEAEVISSVYHLSYLRKNTDDRNAEESCKNIYAPVIIEATAAFLPFEARGPSVRSTKFSPPSDGEGRKSYRPRRRRTVYLYNGGGGGKGARLGGSVGRLLFLFHVVFALGSGTIHI